MLEDIIQKIMLTSLVLGLSSWLAHMVSWAVGPNYLRRLFGWLFALFSISLVISLVALIWVQV